MVSNKNLEFWADNHYNVLFEGKHGIGKTAIVKDLFDKKYGPQGDKWLYFSAATMDPWVDFIGVPREAETDGVKHLELIRPYHFATDKVEALFFDELNRAKPKVRNAVMELIQFKTINGKAFPNLKVIWAAINPADGTYDTEKLDPAQQDRFQIKVDLKYEPTLSYFTDRYGKAMAEAAISWWKTLNDEHKDRVSPRRLDYAMEIFSKGGDIRGLVLPKVVNCSKLTTFLIQGTAIAELNNLIKANDTPGIVEFFKQENNYSNTISEVVKDTSLMTKCLPHIGNEKLAACIAKHPRVQNYVKAHKSDFEEVVNQLSSHSQNKSIKRIASELNIRAEVNFEFDLNKIVTNGPRDAFCYESSNLQQQLDEGGAGNTHARKSILDELSCRTGKNCDKVETIETALNVLDQICRRSHINTLEESWYMDRVSATFNSLLVAAQSNGMTPEDVFNNAPHVINKFVSRMNKADELLIRII